MASALLLEGLVRGVTDDAERGHPDVLATAGGVGELLEVLRVQLEDGLGPLVSGLHLLGRRSRAARWRAAATPSAPFSCVRATP